MVHGSYSSRGTPRDHLSFEAFLAGLLAESMYITSHGSFALLEENTTRCGAWGFLVTDSDRRLVDQYELIPQIGTCGKTWFLFRLPNLCLLFLVVVVVVVGRLLLCAWCNYHWWFFNQTNPNEAHVPHHVEVLAGACRFQIVVDTLANHWENRWKLCQKINNLTLTLPREIGKRTSMHGVSCKVGTAQGGAP